MQFRKDGTTCRPLFGVQGSGVTGAQHLDAGEMIAGMRHERDEGGPSAALLEQVWCMNDPSVALWMPMANMGANTTKVSQCWGGEQLLRSLKLTSQGILSTQRSALNLSAIHL
jgi:hypothetical protein